MLKGFFNVPTPVNEPVLSYAAGSKERQLLQQTIQNMRAKEADIPMYIGGKEVRTNNLQALHPPHDHQHLLGHFHQGDKSHVEQAITAALAAKEKWENLAWEE